MNYALAIVLIVTSFARALAQAEAPKGKVEEARAEVQKLQHEFVAAFSKGSKALAAYLEVQLAEEAVITDQNGRYDKAKALEMAKMGDRDFLEMEQRDLKLSVHGDTVVVTGLIAAKALPQEAFRFTTVYIKIGARWQIIAIQFTPVARP